MAKVVLLNERRVGFRFDGMFPLMFLGYSKQLTYYSLHWSWGTSH